MMEDKDRETQDEFLDERLARVEGWMQEGKVPFSSKVIPVRESLSAQQWVLPTGRVLEILRNARSFAVTHCACRSHYRRCDNPTEVCFLLNDVADRRVADGSARYLSLDEATVVLRQANERGLVHLTIYHPEQHIYAVCSCCSCCCHDLQSLLQYSRHDLIARSDYIAVTDMQACSDCGDCIERCIFGARIWQDGEMGYDPAACYGCGLCVSACPAGAIVMERRATCR